MVWSIHDCSGWRQKLQGMSLLLYNQGASLQQNIWEVRNGNVKILHPNVYIHQNECTSKCIVCTSKSIVGTSE